MPSLAPPLAITIPTPTPRYRASSRNGTGTRSRSASIDSMASVTSVTAAMDCLPSYPVQRWNGLTREATDWNSLRRDPEIFFPSGNCLIYLYTQGASRRGPSFRMPYDFLLYSSCRPLIEQALLTSIQDPLYHPGSNTPPSYDSLGDVSATDHTYLCLYLDAPEGYEGREAFKYHVTTRNFFAWLVGVPLVGSDPVSALLDLKVRMDMWRDAGADNFGALYQFVQEQGYGDFEDIEIQMGRRLEGEPAAEPVMGPYRNIVAQEPKPALPVFGLKAADKQKDDSRGRTSGFGRTLRSTSRKLRRKFSRSKVMPAEQGMQPSQEDAVHPPVPVQVSVPAPLPSPPSSLGTSYMGASSGTSARPDSALQSQTTLASARASIMSRDVPSRTVGDEDAPRPGTANSVAESGRRSRRQSLVNGLKRRLSWAAGPLRPSDDDDMATGAPGAGGPGGGPPGAGPPGGIGVPPAATRQTPGPGAPGSMPLTIQTQQVPDTSSQSAPGGPASAPIQGSSTEPFRGATAAHGMHNSARTSQASMSYFDDQGMERCTCCGKLRKRGRSSSVMSHGISTPMSATGSGFGHGAEMSGGLAAGRPRTADGAGVVNQAGVAIPERSGRRTPGAQLPTEGEATISRQTSLRDNDNNNVGGLPQASPAEAGPVQNFAGGIFPSLATGGPSAPQTKRPDSKGAKEEVKKSGGSRRRSWRRSIEIMVPGYGNGSANTNGIQSFDFGLGRKKKSEGDAVKGKNVEREEVDGTVFNIVDPAQARARSQSQTEQQQSRQRQILDFQQRQLMQQTRPSVSPETSTSPALSSNPTNITNATTPAQQASASPTANTSRTVKPKLSFPVPPMLNTNVDTAPRPLPSTGTDTSSANTTTSPFPVLPHFDFSPISATSSRRSSGVSGLGATDLEVLGRERERRSSGRRDSNVSSILAHPESNNAGHGPGPLSHVHDLVTQPRAPQDPSQQQQQQVQWRRSHDIVDRRPSGGRDLESERRIAGLRRELEAAGIAAPDSPSHQRSHSRSYSKDTDKEKGKASQYNYNTSINNTNRYTDVYDDEALDLQSSYDTDDDYARSFGYGEVNGDDVFGIPGMNRGGGHTSNNNYNNNTDAVFGGVQQRGARGVGGGSATKRKGVKFDSLATGAEMRIGE